MTIQSSHLLKEKYLLIFLFCFWLSDGVAQNLQTKTYFDYTVGKSIIQNRTASFEPKFCHFGHLALEVVVSKYVNPILGLGLINLGDIEIVNKGGVDGIRLIEERHQYNYSLLTLGFHFQVGPLSIIPQYASGGLMSSQLVSVVEKSNGNQNRIIENRRRIGLNKSSNAIIVNLGYKFKLWPGEVLLERNLIVGLKGFYGLDKIRDVNPEIGSWRGVGINVVIEMFSIEDL